MDDPLIEINQTDLARFMPMHMILDKNGNIKTVGPLLQKIMRDTQFQGRNFLDIFCFHRPHDFHGFDQIVQLFDAKIVINSNCGRLRKMAGIFAPLAQTNDVMVNLNLGIGLTRLVDQYQLAATDFAPTDTSVDLLYMIEMQQAVLGAARGLNNQLNGAKIEAEQLAITDPLTGLGNRRALLRFVRRLLSRDLSKKFALILMDLDHFKAVNDSLGHAAGDHVLQTVAHRLLAETRPLDMVARLGGDEFVMVLPDFGSEKTLESFFTRIIRKISEPMTFQSDSCTIGVSMGAIVTNGDNFDTIDQILSASDTALYRSKNQGRGQFTIVSN